MLCFILLLYLSFCYCCLNVIVYCIFLKTLYGIQQELKQTSLNESWEHYHLLLYNAIYKPLSLTLNHLNVIFWGTLLKGHWTSSASSPNFFQKQLGFLYMLAWVMTACWVPHYTSTHFWRNMNISSILYFSKSTSINTQYSSLWDTL